MAEGCFPLYRALLVTDETWYRKKNAGELNQLQHGIRYSMELELEK